MSLEVVVEPQGGEVYRVRVGDRTEHQVTARPEVLARVARAGETPSQTISRAFRFLLEREPPESILRRFALEEIAHYFPEFWTEMAIT